MYKDQTGKFPHRSIRGNRYQMILHEIDGKSTWIEPTKKKDRGGDVLGPALRLGTDEDAGHSTYSPSTRQLNIHRVQNGNKKISMTYQLVPPDDHRRNLAEKEIQMWKNHFIGGMSVNAESFPEHLLFQAIPEAEQQLLIL